MNSNSRYRRISAVYCRERPRGLYPEGTVPLLTHPDSQDRPTFDRPDRVVNTEIVLTTWLKSFYCESKRSFLRVQSPSGTVPGCPSGTVSLLTHPDSQDRPTFDRPDRVVNTEIVLTTWLKSFTCESKKSFLRVQSPTGTVPRPGEIYERRNQMKPFFTENLQDPVMRARVRSGCRLRSYQAEAFRTIYDAVIGGTGGRFTVTFPRQSGKNETQAQLESAVMAASQDRGGNIIKILPTEKNQGAVSRDRLVKVLRGGEQMFLSGTDRKIFSKLIKAKKEEIRYGSTRVRCLSASPNSAIVGATADLMLEVDEAQMVPPEKFDREAAPMAASANAVQIFWGTAWDDRTLLSRESRLARLDEDRDGKHRVFCTTAAEVGKEVPEYGEFVKEQIERLGREHPAIRTQFFCEEISDLTSMFTPERVEAMKGSHAPLYQPEAGRCYVFLIDIAGSDELTPYDKRANGFSDRRDATVVTICDVYLPEGENYNAKNFVWKVAARRLYRNLTADSLKKAICRDVDFWKPGKIILDHSGLGSMLSGFLTDKYPRICRPFDITAAAKTKMAWDFLAMVNSGRWQEYKSDELKVLTSSYVPGKDVNEALSDPDLLQQMFFRELRACRMEPTGNGQTVRWGVKDGARDHVTGRLIHDDLVMSAALSVFEDGSLPLTRDFSKWVPPAVTIDPATGRPYKDWW